MERLTEVVTDTFGKTRVVLSEPSKNSICGGCRFPNECDRCSLYKAVKKLNAIEDILNGYDINRLKELVEADREGRCVVMPVKEGDTVYRITWNPFEDDPPEIFDCAFHITDYYSIGRTVFLTEEEAEKAIEKMKASENDG